MLTRAHIATLAFALIKTIHSAGLNYFSTDEFGKWAFHTDTPEGASQISMNTLMLLTMLGGIGINLFVSIPAFYRQFTPSTPIENAVDTRETSIGEKIVSLPLKAGAWSYGVMTAFLGYFLTQKLSELIASLSGTKTDDALWKLIIIDISALLVAAVVFLKYAAYDIKLCQNNANRISSAIIKRDLPFDKAAAITSILALLTLLIYPMQAFFFAKPALQNIPLINKSEFTVNALTAICCLVTFITVINWLPAIYDFFSQKSASADERAPLLSRREHALIKPLRAIAYGSGLLDSSAQGMAAFMGIIVVASTLFGLGAYSPFVIIAAALAMLNGIILNMSFSVAPGVNKTLNETRRFRLFQEKETPSTAVLLAAVNVESDVESGMNISQAP